MNKTKAPRRPSPVEVTEDWVYVEGASPKQRDICTTYKIYASCTKLGKLVAGSKRKLSWRFGVEGVPNSGRTANGVVGKEFEVQLIWSLNSGKWQLLWNNHDITSQVREYKRDTKPTKHSIGLGLAWQHMGKSFRIVAQPNVSPGMKKYDFFVDGASFESLPSVPEILARQREAVSLVASEQGFECITRKATKDERRDFYAGKRRASNEANRSPNRRESKVGNFASIEKTLSFDEQSVGAAAVDGDDGDDHGDALEEELGSGSYKKRLDTLRILITAAVPQTEDIVAKKVMYALFSDHEADDYSDSSLDCDSQVKPIEVEANSLRDALHWLEYTVNAFHGEEDATSLKLQYLEGAIEVIFSRVRDECLRPSQASSIVRSVCAVLRLELTNPMQRDTIVLTDLDEDVTSEDLESAMKQFGPVQSAGVSENGGFGICRFHSTSSVDMVLKEGISVCGEEAEVFELTDLVTETYMHVEASTRHDMGPIDEESVGSFEEYAMRSPAFTTTKSVDVCSPASTECTEATTASINSEDLSFLSVAVLERA